MDKISFIITKDSFRIDNYAKVRYTYMTALDLYLFENSIDRELLPYLIQNVTEM